MDFIDIYFHKHINIGLMLQASYRVLVSSSTVKRVARLHVFFC